jgi:hypothetical protein
MYTIYGILNIRSASRYVACQFELCSFRLLLVFQSISLQIIMLGIKTRTCFRVNEKLIKFKKWESNGGILAYVSIVQVWK